MGFEVTPSALGIAAAEAERVRDALGGAVGDVRAEVTSLVGDGWRGGAATAFLAGHDEWQRGAAQVVDALATIGTSLAATRTAYAASDDVAADVFTRLSARLGA